MEKDKKIIVKDMNFQKSIYFIKTALTTKPRRHETEDSPIPRKSRLVSKAIAAFKISLT